jgi:signal transduction histidine kinase
MKFFYFHKLQDYLIKKIKRIPFHLNASIIEYQRQIKTFGVIFFINYPIYYLVWKFGSIQAYENLFLRLSASMLCVPLIFCDYWKIKFKNFFPFYWYFTVIYCLPFFFLFMTLNNHGSAPWLLNLLLQILLTFLLFDLPGVILVNLFGFLSAWLLYSLIEGNEVIFKPSTIDMVSALSTIAATFVVGSIFVHNRGKIEHEKLQTMKSLGATLAHELRTPLGAIKSGVVGLKNYVPELLRGFKIAQANKLITSDTENDQLEMIPEVLDSINDEANHASAIIELLLTNINQQEIKKEKFSICSIFECVDYALAHYPFLPSQKEKIEWDVNKSKDFKFLGDKLLIVHILFNLVKNALYFTEKARKGKIYIWLEEAPKYNQLHFKDTGQGIDEKDLPHIFDRFFTKNTHRGSGIGLAFCKMVMEAHHGKIICRSIKGEYAEFILLFQKIERKLLA